MEKISVNYINDIKSRTLLSYLKGLIVRAYKRAVYSTICGYARLKGATIGNNTIIPFRLAKKANENLIIGNDVIIESDDLDLRSKIIIHDHVIINRGVKILRVSHYIDNSPCYITKYYKDLNIESYSWLATSCTILPSVSLISKSSIIGACAVLAKDSEKQGVYSGNPAVVIRKHDGEFNELIVCSLKGGDYNYYKRARKS